MLEERENGTPGETPGETLMRALGNMQRHEADGGTITTVMVLGVVTYPPCDRYPEGTVRIVTDETPGLLFYTRLGLLQAVADDLRMGPYLAGADEED